LNQTENFHFSVAGKRKCRTVPMSASQSLSASASASASARQSRDFSGDSDIRDPSDSESDGELNAGAKPRTAQRPPSPSTAEVIRIGSNDRPDGGGSVNGASMGSISLSEHFRRSVLSESSARRSAAESPRFSRSPTPLSVLTRTRTRTRSSVFDEEEDIPDPSDGLSEDEASL
jgi:hypothetical protein